MNRTPVYTLLDILYLLLLAAYVLAGVPLASFHGDEPMQIYMSRDFETAFVARNPAALTTQPPYPIDSDQHLRILNGSVNRYAIGLARALAGIGADQLPPRPGWDWGLVYADNAATGHVPSDALMLAGRLPSALFLAGSVFVIFGIGWQLGSANPRLARPLAYIVTALYGLNPIILLNGRRALQEGALLFFGLLAILTAAVIARRRSNGKPIPVYAWAGLVLSSALTLASKHNGIVFVGAALGWVFVGELTHFDLRGLLRTAVALVLCGGLIALLFVALSPALWNDPLARLGDLLAVRAELLDIQTVADPLAPTTLSQRVEAIITQPFLTPPAHFEVSSWATFEPITEQVNRYMASPLSGVQFGAVGGLALTALAGIGIVVLLSPALRPNREWASSAGVLLWLALTAASLLANPLPWQRYYLPLIPVAALLAGISSMAIARALVVRYKQDAPAEAGAYGSQEA